ncbi:hypothetical protein GCM10010129_84160 [Streptomyces fumigatiscleroticus]|nr:hypothetical protein GCM10010129_84160 [Streptomyces fumigatiscleroticus]
MATTYKDKALNIPIRDFDNLKGLIQWILRAGDGLKGKGATVVAGENIHGKLTVYGW